MKRFFYLFLLGYCTIAACMAASQYDFGWGGGAFHIDKGPSTAFLALKDAQLTISLAENKSSASRIDFGVITVDASRNILSEFVITDIGSLEGAVVSPTLHEGDLVGFWVSVDGKKYQSIHGMNAGGITKDGWVVKNGEITLGFETSGSPYQGYENLDIFFHISAQAPAPKGQPLPGVCATMAVGAVATAFLKRRRRRA